MFTVTQLARLLGLKADSIKHYTELGILLPRTDPWNHYRHYSIADMLLTGHTKALRSLDLSLPEIQAFHGAPYDRQLAMLEARTEALEQTIEALIARKTRLEEVKRFVAKATRCEGVVEDVERDAIHSLYTAGGTRSHAAEMARVGAWLANLPYIHLSLKIPLEELNDTHRTEPYNVEFGVGITDAQQKRIKLDLSAPVESIPGGRCLILYLKSFSPQRLTPKELDPLFDYARAHGLHFLNNTSGRILTIENTPEGPLFYLLIRVRVGN